MSGLNRRVTALEAAAFRQSAARMAGREPALSAVQDLADQVHELGLSIRELRKDVGESRKGADEINRHIAEMMVTQAQQSAILQRLVEKLNA